MKSQDLWQTYVLRDWCKISRVVKKLKMSVMCFFQELSLFINFILGFI